MRGIVVAAWLLAGCGRLHFGDDPSWLARSGDAGDAGDAARGQRDASVDAPRADADPPRPDAAFDGDPSDADLPDADAESADADADPIDAAASTDADADPVDADPSPDADADPMDADPPDADADPPDADADPPDADAASDADADASPTGEVCNVVDDDLDGFIDEDLLVPGPITVLSATPAPIEDVTSAPERGEAAVVFSGGPLVVARGEDGARVFSTSTSVGIRATVAWDGSSWFVAGGTQFQRVSVTGVAGPVRALRTMYPGSVRSAVLHTGGRTLIAVTGNDWLGATSGGSVYMALVEGDTVLWERALETRGDGGMYCPIATAEGDQPGPRSIRPLLERRPAG